MRDFAPVIQHCVERMAARTNTDACRLFHGRGRCFPGFEDLVVDLFDQYLLIGLFSEEQAGMDRLANALAQLPDVAGVGLQVRQGRKTNMHVLIGSVPDVIVATEAGLQFIVKPQQNQNIGLFLDMEPARAWLRQWLSDRSQHQACQVLNLFAFTCAFSVAAIDAGASTVVNNDMSRNALQWGEENHRLNKQDHRLVRMLPHNLFKSWWKIKSLGPYDLVVIDPPTNQRGSFNAEKDYPQVLKRLPEFMKPGGAVMACLNSPFLPPDFLIHQMQRWCDRCEFTGWLESSPGFADAYPERALKVGLFIYR